MTHRDLEQLLRSLKGGKRVGRDLYFHVSHPEIARFLSAFPSLALTDLAPDAEANVIKIHRGQSGVALSGLFYEDFFNEPFPALSWSQRKTLGVAHYTRRRESANPAILHRKELLLAHDHPKWEEYAALTESLILEKLLPAPAFIGRRRQWLNYLSQRGFRVVGHSLQRTSESL
jgi:hypothetical protein